MGKSSYVHEIKNAVSEKNGIYIEGKFDEFQKDIPFYAFRQAFQEFVNIILKENEAKLNYWKKLIQKAVGNLGQLLTATFTELELIIGKQADIPALEGKEALNRFNHLWINFIKSIAGSKHPLVVFLKDMQWADNASIELLRTLLTDNEINYFLCITAFRSSELNTSHPFILLRHDLEKEDIKTQNITLENLAKKDITNLLTDALQSQNRTGFKELAELVYSKTSGNPFFTNEFLKTIYESELLKFDFIEKQWIWNIEEIENYSVTDNVVELLSNKIQQLPTQTQEVLKIVSCIGNKFDLKIVTIILQSDIDETKKDIEHAVFEGIIKPEGKQHFRFVHNKLLQAVYSLIPEKEKKQFHLQIGQILLENTPEPELQKNIFEIVNQLNYAIDLITETSEKQQLTKLNFIAGQSAKQSVAFETAYKYIETASRLLPENCWQTDYQFSLEIYNELAELSYLIAKYKKTEQLVNHVIENTKEITDAIQVYSILINSYTAQSKYNDAIETGRKVIAQLGVKLPEKPTMAHIVKEFIITQVAIGRRQTKDFANLPLMTNKSKFAIIKLFQAIGSPAYLANPELFPVLILKSIRIFIKYGNCTYSPYLYAGYSILLSIMKKIDKGVEFANLAKDLIPSLNAKQDSAKINFILYSFNKIWKAPLQIVIPSIRDTYKMGTEVGDLTYASYGLMNMVLNLYCNKPLHQTRDKAINKIETLKKLKQEFSLLHILNVIQISDNLITINENPCHLKGDYFDEDIEIQKANENKNFSILSIIYVNKLFLHTIFNELENTKIYLSELEKYKEINEGSYYFVTNNFYRSLIYLRHYENEKNNTYLKKVNKNQKNMKFWAKHCPENFLHKYYLVEAEKMRVQNKFALAKNFYDKAIGGANKNQFLGEEAISWEAAARFYFQQDNAILAKSYIQNAYNCYKRWGALAKLKQLEEVYSQSIFEKQSTISTSNSVTSTMISTSSGAGSSSSLDLTSIVKASQSLSGEVKLENLLKSMLMLIMENAGSEYAVIIKNEEGKFTIEAKGRHSSGDIKVLQSEDLEKSDDVALNIVSYVIRTRKLLVIDDALSNKEYSGNEYIQKNKVKSVFCYPVIHKNKLVAILYLENNLSSHVFTSGHIEAINILSSQIAVSIENALLYENLEDKVKTRTKELSKVNSKLQVILKRVNEQKEEIENSHRKTTDSINYASRIQNAILPALEIFEDYFSDYFVLFKPRDVVSGDFYWAKKVNEHLIFVAADCTGHGVPGAFVSMLGISFLNEIAQSNSIWKSDNKASQLLELLRDKVKTAFRRKGDISDRKDGMDLALCIIDTKTKKLQYAGANNPLCIVRGKSLPEIEIADVRTEVKGDFRITQIKPDAMPIGIYSRESSFQNQEIQLANNDKLYLFSDGFLDQLGLKSGKKFMIRNFRNLLLDIHQKPMTEQKQILDETLKNWMGKKYMQVDDILVMGVKI